MLANKDYRFDLEKSKKLRSERGIGFEEIIALLDEDHLLNIDKHPNQTKYSHQNIYAVLVDSYVYLVPFVSNGNEIFLKTIIPSRKATAQYLDKDGRRKI